MNRRHGAPENNLTERFSKVRIQNSHTDVEVDNIECHNDVSLTTGPCGSQNQNLPVSHADAIVWSVKNGDLTELHKYVGQLEPAALNDLFVTGTRPLIVIAADYGQNDVIQFLLEHGCDVNVQDQFGITPLLAAIWEGHAGTVELLLRCGADLNRFRSPEGRTYCEEAAENRIVARTIAQFVNENKR